MIEENPRTLSPEGQPHRPEMDAERGARDAVAQARKRQTRRANAIGAQTRAGCGTKGHRTATRNTRAPRNPARTRDLDTNREPKGDEERRPTATVDRKQGKPEKPEKPGKHVKPRKWGKPR